MNKLNKIILVYIFLVIFVVSLIGCSNKNSHEGEAKTPSGSSIQAGKNYLDVIEDFEEEGFTNIKTEKLGDLVTGWLTKDGEVEEVTVGGDVDYSPDRWVSADTEVIITYHTFPEGVSETVTENEPSEENSQAEASQELASQEAASQEQAIIINVNNNEEFAAVLNAVAPFDPIVRGFATKYAGQTIEFDGNITYMNNHGNYKTRYDFLITPWDYSETTDIGPNFFFEDCNYYDLNLTGDNIPNAVRMGDNLHFVAVIGELDEVSELFHLKPISTAVR